MGPASNRHLWPIGQRDSKTMNNYLVIAIIAGLCTTLLNISGYVGGVFGLGFLLVLAAPLPVMIASLGWGSFAGLIAALISGLTTAILISPLAGLLFVILTSLPAWWLCHLLGLSRVDEETGEVYWYPLSRLLVWIAGIASAASISMFIPFGFSLDSYMDAITTLVKQIYDTGQFGETGLNLEGLVTLVGRLAPTASAFMLVFSMAVNLFIAGKVVYKSGRLARPWPDLHWLSMPPVGAYIFLASLIGLFLLSDLPGIFAQIVASCFGAALLMVGLSVLHFLTKGNPFRMAILWTTYFLLVIMQWIGFFLVILGTSEVLLSVRSRRMSRSGQDGSGNGSGGDDGNQNKPD